MAAVSRVLHSGRLILGPETDAFEAEFAAYVGVRACVGVASGTTALHTALLALDIGPGDEVITVSNTCVPTIAAIRLTGARPVFVDVKTTDLLMDPARAAAAITPRTRCILPVHLWGQSADLDALEAVAEEAGVALVEDCAQAQGTHYRGKHVGTTGRMGCFSFYPTKNLGAFGDAGAVVTDDPALAERLRRLRVYGYDDSGIAQTEGLNARISEIQAAILRVKLRVLPDWLAKRRTIAHTYDTGIQHAGIRLPCPAPDTEAAYHQYVVQCADRAAVTAALTAADIGFGIHYPVPVHLMPAYAFLGGETLDLPVTTQAACEILSLPIHEGLTADETGTVVATLNAAPA